MAKVRTVAKRGSSLATLAGMLVFATATMECATATTASAAATPTRVSTLGAAARPAVVPGDYLVTPNGYFHESCVHHIATGETVRADGTVRRQSGAITRMAPCAYPRFLSDGKRIEPSAQGTSASGNAEHVESAHGVPPPEISGWMSAAFFYAPAQQTPGAFTGHMTVPSDPTVPGEQVVYFFPGLETSDSSHDPYTILQPVLGWNGWGDHAWSIASWNCCVDGNTNYSDYLPVATGADIAGSMVPSSCTGEVCDSWIIASTDIASNQTVTLQTESYDQNFDLVFGAVLEAYGIEQCGQYPSNGSINFSSLALADLSGTPMDLFWQAWDPSSIIFIGYFDGHDPNCAYGVSATVGTTNGTGMTINWRTQ